MKLSRTTGFWFYCLTGLAVVVTLAPFQSWAQVQGWSEEKSLVQAGTIENRVTSPSIAVNGDQVYIVYRQKHINVIRSDDRGKNWSDPVVINPDQPINSHPTIAVFGSQVVAVWSSYIRVGEGLNTLQLYYSESSNRGIRWSEPRRITDTRDITVKPIFLNLGDRALLAWLETPLQETLGRISSGANAELTPESIDELFAPGALAQGLQAQQQRVRARFFVSTYTPRSGFSNPVSQPDENFGQHLPHLFTLFGPSQNKFYIALNENTAVKLYESADNGQSWSRSFDETSFFDTRYLYDLKIINNRREGIVIERRPFQQIPVLFFRGDSIQNAVQLSPPHYVRDLPRFARSDGDYHVVWEAGNQERSQITYMRTDTIFPTTEIVLPTNPAIQESRVTFGWRGDDNISYSERLLYSYSIEENQWSSLQSETTVTMDTPPDGEYVFRLRAEDVAGNIQNPVTEFPFNTYQSAPDSEWVNPPSPSDPLSSRSVTIRFSSQDNNDPPSQILYSVQVNDGEWSEFQSGGEHIFTQLPNGEHVLRIRTQDSRGNIDPTPAQCRVTVNVGLELVLESQPGLNSNEETSVFTWTSKDDLGNPVELQCFYSLNGEAAQPATSSTSLELSGLDEGRHIVKIWGADPSGDTSSEIEYRWVIDRTPPETTAAFHREYNNGKALIALEANDPDLPDGSKTVSPAEYEYKIGEDDWKKFSHHGGNWIMDQPLPFYAWGYILQVRAIDRAGNMDTTPATVDLRIFARSNPYIFYSVVGVAVIALLYLLKMMIPAGGGTRRKPVAATEESSTGFDTGDEGLDMDAPKTKKSSFGMDGDDDPYA